MPGNGYCHDADRTGTGDQHIFSYKVAGKGGVGGISERIEDGGNVIRNGIGHYKGIHGGYAEVFGKTSLPVDADTDGVAAEMSSSCPAVAAVSAGDVAFSGDPITGVDALDFIPYLFNDAYEFMADGHRHRDGSLRPLVPIVDVDVSSADCGF